MPNHGFSYGGATILSHPVFVEAILPFLLVFTIVFAILQKSKILGEGKKQIDAIVALVIGLLVISFGNAVGIIIQLIPFLAVSLVVILVLIILLGSVIKEGEFYEKFPKALRVILTIAIVIAVVSATLVVTGGWDFLYEFIFIKAGGSSQGILINGLFLLVIAGAIITVLIGSSKGSSQTTKHI